MDTDAVIRWIRQENKRVTHEWDVEWDGSPEHAEVINDRQCERAQAARQRWERDGLAH